GGREMGYQVTVLGAIEDHPRRGLDVVGGVFARGVELGDKIEGWCRDGLAKDRIMRLRILEEVFGVLVLEGVKLLGVDFDITLGELEGELEMAKSQYIIAGGEGQRISMCFQRDLPC